MSWPDQLVPSTVKMAMLEIMTRRMKNQLNEERVTNIVRILLMDNQNWTTSPLVLKGIENLSGYLEDEKRIKPWMIFGMGLKCPPSLFLENTCLDSDRGSMVHQDKGESPEHFKQRVMNSVYASHLNLMTAVKYDSSHGSLSKSTVGFLEVVDRSGDIIPRDSQPTFSLRTIHPQPYLHESDPEGRMGKLAWRGGMLPPGSISMLGSTPNHCGMKLIQIYGIMFWFLWPSTQENVDMWNEHSGEPLTLEWGLQNLKGLQINPISSKGAEFEPGTIICILAATECCWMDLYYLSDDIADRVLSVRRRNALWRRKREKEGESWEPEDPQSKLFHMNMAKKLGRQTWFDFDP